jgi:membrane protease YdiL (CAAX protease family)
MILASLGVCLIHRHELDSYGFGFPKWRFGLNVAAAVVTTMLLVGLIEMALLPTGSLTPTTISPRLAVAVAALRVPLYLALFLVVVRIWQQSAAGIPAIFPILLLLLLLVVAPTLAIYRGASAWRVLGSTSSLMLCTALGEELFFRGYLQSRLNGVFGRPWRLLGLSFGPGMLISSLLFGAIHVFNPTRPWEGHWEFSWLWGMNAFLVGLLYASLREMTGSVWPGMLVHGLTGVHRGIGQVFLFQ